MSAPLRVWVDRDGALLRLRLARPKANVLDAQMIAAIAAAFGEHRDPGAIRAALVDHEGPHFSFGASVEEHLPAQCAAMLAGLHALLVAMLEWPRPILFAVRGQCLGGGLEFALAGTRLIVAPDAQLGQPEMKLGVFAPAASALLPFRVSQPVAEDLLFSGRSVGAGEALALGIAQAVADDPAAAALEYFDAHLAGKSASSIGFAVRAARAGMLEEARRRIAAVEKLYLEGLMATHDAVEGLDAFLAKRPAAWRHA
ncbi:MAG: cyclohexa-1,5-dienecarbonyl-CoA hydratase [Burkholderiales bacterium]|nr:cyclohexa-1,5-dienecarbonyl-CoA hydratase [Burkholderiales bacterium]